MSQVNIVLTCPKCGNDEWMSKKDGEFKCCNCGKILCPAEMGYKTRKIYRELSVSVNGGSLVAFSGNDSDYPSVGIMYRTENDDLLDIAFAECKRADNNQDIDVFTFDDVYTEDYQRKFTLRKKDIDEAFG